MRALLLALSLVLLVPGSSNAGDTVVFHSPDDTGDPASISPWLLTLTDGQELHLYLRYDNPGGGGSTSGTLCVDANGDETCGFDVKLEMQTDVATFGTFEAASAAVVGYVDLADAKTFRANGLDLSGLEIPSALGAQVVPIGTLEVNAAGAEQVVIETTGMHRVGAGGQLEAIQSQVIALPEPGGIAPPFVGLLAVAGLAWRRRRIAARR
jgi:hypothetical protein